MNAPTLDAARDLCDHLQAHWAEAPRCTCPPGALYHALTCPIAQDLARLRAAFLAEDPPRG